MKLGVTGSRSILESAAFIDYLNQLQPEVIISGGAVGVDTIAERWAKENQITLIIKRPEYALYGRMAPMIRNMEIVKACDALVAVWDRKSKGTGATIKMAERSGKLLKIIYLT
jgi:hypothetical protein